MVAGAGRVGDATWRCCRHSVQQAHIAGNDYSSRRRPASWCRDVPALRQPGRGCAAVSAAARPRVEAICHLTKRENALVD